MSRRFVYPMYVLGVLAFVAVFVLRDYRRNQDLIGLASSTLIPLALLYLLHLAYVRIRYRQVFEANSTISADTPGALVVCSSQKRPGPIPAHFGTWPKDACSPPTRLRPVSY